MSDVSGGAFHRIQVRPTPTDDELAAIVAAYEALWPADSELVEAPRPDPVWRFSGRWWVQQSRALRSTPWIRV